MRGPPIFEERRVVGLGVGLRLPCAQFSKVVFQIEQSVTVDGVIASGGLLGRTVREEVVRGEHPQRVRPFVVYPIHHVPRVGGGPGSAGQ